MTNQNAKIIKDLQNLVYSLNDGLYRDNFKISMKYEEDGEDVYVTFFLNNDSFMAGTAKEMNVKREVLFALVNAFHYGYMAACKVESDRRKAKEAAARSLCPAYN